MKDLVVTSSRLKKEGIILLICFLASVGLNIYAISKYKSDWSELISQLPIVIGITFLIYLLVFLFRLVFLSIAKLIQKN